MNEIINITNIEENEVKKICMKRKNKTIKDIVKYSLVYSILIITNLVLLMTDTNEEAKEATYVYGLWINIVIGTN